jgi:hypothetical protein
LTIKLKKWYIFKMMQNNEFSESYKEI